MSIWWISACARRAGVLHLFDAIVHAFAAAMGQLSVDLARRLDEVEHALLDAHEQGDYRALGVVRCDAVRLSRCLAARVRGGGGRVGGDGPGC